jgi:RNA polymerase sigma factor (sigma-70 family)
MTKIKQIKPDPNLGVNSTSSGLPASFRSKVEINKFLERNYNYIVKSVLIQVGHSSMFASVYPENASDLAQTALIALWRKLTSEQGQINSPKAYIRRIVHSSFVDAIRTHKPIFPLPVDQEGELYQGRILLIPGEGAQDPADEFEREELIAEVIEDVLRLPPHQQYAMICMLKDEVGDTFPLVEAFRKRGIDIRKMDWPQEAVEAQKLRSSLSAARKKLRSIRSKYSFV